MQVVDRNGRLKVEITNAVDELTVGVTNIVGGVSGRALYDNAGILGELDLASTYVPLSRTLTINGTTQDLSANRTFTVSTGITIGTTAITSGTVGRVLFEGTGNVVQESANLFWDNTNNIFNVTGLIKATQNNIHATHVGANIKGLYIVNNSDSVVRAGLQFDGSTAFVELVGRYNNGTPFFRQDGGNGNISFLRSGSEYGRIFGATGNWGINTTTDAGFKLDVNGTERVTGGSLIQTLTVGLGAGARSNNTVLGLSALISNTTGNFNVAIGPSSLSGNTTGTGNISVGHFAAAQITTGANNVALGREALSNNNSSGNVVVGMQACNTATGSNNVVLGFQSQAGNFNGSIVLGINASATAGNQFVVGSTGTNAGSVTTEVNASTQVWNVIINGVARKILLA